MTAFLRLACLSSDFNALFSCSRALIFSSSVALILFLLSILPEILGFTKSVGEPIATLAGCAFDTPGVSIF